MAYSPLAQNKDQIRLLVLAPKYRWTGLPRRINRALRVLGDGQIHCSFRLADLHNCPSFEALSYTWGDHTDTVPVLLDDTSFRITRNLHSALLGLRNDYEERVLWVDALCINQKDLQERTRQVAHMRYIYATASRVIAWLDKGSDSMEIAMEYIKMAAQHNETNASDWPEFTVRSLSLRSEELRDHIAGFFEKSWWKRVWTVQEFALAQWVVFQCGDCTVTEGDVSRFCRFWNTHIPYDELQYFTYGVPGKFSHIVGGINRFLSLLSSRQLKDSRRFLLILASFQDRKCSDNRDRIYGMLGMAEERYTKLIIPDYTCSLEQVFEKTTLSLIEVTNNLEVLSANDTSKLKGLPSFVPDWSSTPRIPPNAQIKRLLSYSRYRTNRGTEAEVRHIGAGKLATKAVIWDEISTIVETMSRHPKALLKSSKESFLKGNDELYYIHTGQPIEEALVRTLFGDIVNDRQGADAAPTRIKEDQLRLIREWEGQAMKAQSYDANPEPDSHPFEVRVLIHTSGRNFFRSKKGYIGFTTTDAKIGDLIAILPGGRVPYILRQADLGPESKLQKDNPEKTHPCFYNIIGDAYVHGIMDGEVFDMMSQNVCTLEDIVLV